jgi:hypothetical protein
VKKKRITFSKSGVPGGKILMTFNPDLSLGMKNKKGRWGVS